MAEERFFLSRRQAVHSIITCPIALLSGCMAPVSENISDNAKKTTSNANEYAVVTVDYCALSFDGSKIAITPDYNNYSHLRIIDWENMTGFVLAPNIKGSIVGSPTFSPDGKAIAFVVQNIKSMGQGEIWIKWFDSDRLEKIKWDVPRIPIMPVFSWDGKKIAYGRGIENLVDPKGAALPYYANCIFEWDLETKKEKQITETPFDGMTDITYLPNNLDLIFTGGRELVWSNANMWEAQNYDYVCYFCGRYTVRPEDGNGFAQIKPFFEEEIIGREKITYTLLGTAQNGSSLVWYERKQLERYYFSPKVIESYIAIYLDGKFTPVKDYKAEGAVSFSGNGKIIGRFYNAINSKKITEGYIEIYVANNMIAKFDTSQIKWQPEVIYI